MYGLFKLHHSVFLVRCSIFLCSLSASAQTLSGEKSLQFNDSVPVTVRPLSEATIQQFRENSDFDYGIRRKATTSGWDRLKYWFAEQIERLFRYTYFGTIYDILFYTACFAIIVFAVLKLSGTHVSQLFSSRSDRGLVRGDALEEDIHTIDFAHEIAQAERDEDYRRGIRLLYLWALKQLTDRQLIRWQAGKTNHDYQAELTDTPLRDPFRQLSYYYEYAWYGNFTVDESRYRRAEALFQQLTPSSKTPA